MVMALFAFQQISKAQLAIGVLQFASSWLIIGYIWSIAWGILILFKARDTTENTSPPVNSSTVNMNHHPAAV